LSFVQAASANLPSATALVGVAMANRLPVISLTADLGSSPASLANLFSPPTLFYALANNVAQTAFDDFTLYHRQETAEAALEQADAHRSTVITAFQNVADTLRALRAPLKPRPRPKRRRIKVLRSRTSGYCSRRSTMSHC
jgi:outer membrane protein TolC